MTKPVFWNLRVSELLDEQTRAYATKRGMNLSEFIRYALTSFFERHDDNCLHSHDRLPPMPDPMTEYPQEVTE